jgi:flagellin-specific chaperone FliS
MKTLNSMILERRLIAQLAIIVKDLTCCIDAEADSWLADRLSGLYEQAKRIQEKADEV